MKSNNEEFGLLMIKPDGVKRNLIDEIIYELGKNKLNIIEVKQVWLCEDDIQNNFSSAHVDMNDYKRYLCSGYVIVILVQGVLASYKLWKIKDLIRKRYGLTSFDKYNLLHTSDPGNEYLRQFKLFFKEKNPVEFSLYADMNVVIKEDAQEIIRHLDFLNYNSNLYYIGLVSELGINQIKPELFNKLEFSRLKVLVGLKKSFKISNTKVSLIGYLPTSHITESIYEKSLLKDKPDEFIDLFKSYKGYVVLDFLELDKVSTKLLKELKKIGLHAVTIYDPRYSLEEVEKYEYIAMDEIGIDLSGGTNGQVPAGLIGIDKWIFDRLYEAFKVEQVIS